MEKITIKNCKMMNFYRQCKDYYFVEATVTTKEAKRIESIGIVPYEQLNRNEWLLWFFPRIEPKKFNRQNKRINCETNYDFLADIEIYILKNKTIKMINIHFIDFIEKEKLCKFIDEQKTLKITEL